MKVLNVRLKETNYPIVVTDSFHEMPQYLKGNHSKVIIISDSNVGKLYYTDVRNSLANYYYEIFHYEISAGEASKSMDIAIKVYCFLMENEFERNDLIIGLGGGVVGDLAGFVAATYLRGINLVHIPTSLLAQSDSSIGGKTAVNMMNIKNIIGTFYQPVLVYINYRVLDTLPIAEIRNGIVEILVHAIIKDMEFFVFMENNLERIMNLDQGLLEELIWRNCFIKKSIVEADEKESGERAILNFGHTFGHAIESSYNYRYKHGECVASGILGACYIAENLNMIDKSVTQRIHKILSRLGVLRDLRDCNWEDILHYMKHDKKRVSEKTRFILTIKIGQVVNREIDDISLIKSAFDLMVSNREV